MTERERIIYAMDPVAFAVERLAFQPDERQQQVLRTDVRRGLLNCTRQWGKSTLTAVKAVHRAMFDDGCLVLVAAPTARQSGEFVRKASAFVSRLGIRARGDGDNAISLLFPNGSRIVGIPGDEGTIRGFSSVRLLLIDEAARVSDLLYKALRPMMAVGSQENELWLMSTPYGKRGFFYQEWTNGGERWTRVRVPATECPRIQAEFLEEEREVLGERWFQQEYLCEFVSADDSVFDEAAIRRCLTSEVEALAIR